MSEYKFQNLFIHFLDCLDAFVKALVILHTTLYPRWVVLQKGRNGKCHYAGAYIRSSSA